LLGLEAVKSRGIQKLIVIGDSELVISQLRETFDTKDEKLKPYKERVTHMLKGFDDMSLRAFHRSFNDVANTLAVAASTSTIIPHDVARKGRCIIDTIHRPSTPDYEEHWHVFEDDQDINNFLQDHESSHSKEKDVINE